MAFAFVSRPNEITVSFGLAAAKTGQKHPFHPTAEVGSSSRLGIKE
ncbi:MAG: hypothetical protein LBM20_08560 [Rikenellaceae bacterium]|nr:hypothetical protein [Rikenellaceae bacterium]